MSSVMRKEKQIAFRTKGVSKRKWQRNEEIALINYIKQNPNFEKPCARVYYTKFLFESGLDVDWKLVRFKVRNMRVTYRKTKEHEMKHADSNSCNVRMLRNEILKMCWYVDEFDVLFPNQMDNYTNKYSDPILDDESSRDESVRNADNSNKMLKSNISVEEESTVSSFAKSIEGDIVIKKEKRDEDTSMLQQETALAKAVLNSERENFIQQRLREAERTPFRNRSKPIRRWQRNEQVAIIVFLKQNRDFEQPTARVYYTKFILESGIDIDWKHVRSKVRNMRVTYRKAKEHEILKSESKNCNIQVLRNEILKICWYVDDFDIIFPNEMDNYVFKNRDPILDDEFSNDESFNNVDNAKKNSFLLQEDSSSSSLSNSVDEDILTVQKNWFNLKKQKRDEDTSIRQKELELARERLNFEKEKFRQEIRLKEKEIESEERLKIMEIQMKERIALKELEIAEILESRSTEKTSNSFNNVYHNLT